jgi:hypothetical protein
VVAAAGAAGANAICGTMDMDPRGGKTGAASAAGNGICGTKDSYAIGDKSGATNTIVVVVADHHFNLDTIIRNGHPSQISYGSNHPLWHHLKEILDNGATFTLDDILDSDRLSDLIFHSNRGNHKSASKHHKALQEIIRDDVERGFALPLPVTALHFLPKASLAP